MNKEAITRIYKDFLSENNLVPEDAVLLAEASAVMMGLLVEVYDISIHVYESRFQMIAVNNNLPTVDGVMTYSPGVEIVTDRPPRYHVIRDGVAFQNPEGAVGDTHRDYDTDVHLVLKNFLQVRITANEALKVLPTTTRLPGYFNALLIPYPEQGDIWVEFKDVRTWWSSLLPNEQRDLWNGLRNL